jgi:excisionase family DNA binding protein
VPDLASVIRQAEKLRERLDLQTAKPVVRGDTTGHERTIKYEVLMTTAHLRQMERTLESMRGGIMTASQVSAYLQISEGRVYEMARSGSIPAVKIGQRWRFKKDRIDRWLDDLERRVLAQQASDKDQLDSGGE